MLRSRWLRWRRLAACAPMVIVACAGGAVDDGDLYGPGAGYPGEGTAAVPTATLGSQDVSSCEPDEQRYGGHCYRTITGEPVTFYQAKLRCEKRGSSMVQIDDPGENVLVYSLLSRPEAGAASTEAGGVWIGLRRDLEDPASFVWTDGTWAGFTDWAPDEPNDANGNEDCVVMWNGLVSSSYRGKWNDIPCLAPTRTVVCERVPIAGNAS